MFTEIVLFDLPAGMSRAEVIANFHATAPHWRANPDLVRKNYLYDPEGKRGGGVYLWRERAAAARWHDAAWREMARSRYGAIPRIEIFETPVLVDNALGQTIEAEPVAG
jgi:hypothetical protein